MMPELFAKFKHFLTKFFQNSQIEESFFCGVLLKKDIVQGHNLKILFYCPKLRTNFILLNYPGPVLMNGLNSGAFACSQYKRCAHFYVVCM